MVWALCAIGLSGLLLGTRFRAPALIIASGLALIGLLAIGLASGWSAGRIVIAIVAALIDLQLAFGLGLLLASASAHRRQGGSSEASSHGASRTRIRLTR